MPHSLGNAAALADKCLLLSHCRMKTEPMSFVDPPLASPATPTADHVLPAPSGNPGGGIQVVSSKAAGFSSEEWEQPNPNCKCDYCGQGRPVPFDALVIGHRPRVQPAAAPMGPSSGVPSTAVGAARAGQGLHNITTYTGPVDPAWAKVCQLQGMMQAKESGYRATIQALRADNRSLTQRVMSLEIALAAATPVPSVQVPAPASGSVPVAGPVKEEPVVPQQAPAVQQPDQAAAAEGSSEGSPLARSPRRGSAGRRGSGSLQGTGEQWQRRGEPIRAFRAQQDFSRDGRYRGSQYARTSPYSRGGYTDRRDRSPGYPLETRGSWRNVQGAFRSHEYRPYGRY